MESPKRVRGKSIPIQTQHAINELEALLSVRRDGRDETWGVELEAVKTKLAALRLLENHKRRAKMTDRAKPSDGMRVAEAKIAELEAEVERLTQALAAKPKVVVREMTDLELALAIAKRDKEVEEKTDEHVRG